MFIEEEGKDNSVKILRLFRVLGVYLVRFSLVRFSVFLLLPSKPLLKYSNRSVALKG